MPIWPVALFLASCDQPIIADPTPFGCSEGSHLSDNVRKTLESSELHFEISINLESETSANKASRDFLKRPLAMVECSTRTATSEYSLSERDFKELVSFKSSTKGLLVYVPGHATTSKNSLDRMSEVIDGEKWLGIYIDWPRAPEVKDYQLTLDAAVGSGTRLGLVIDAILSNFPDKQMSLWGWSQGGNVILKAMNSRRNNDKWRSVGANGATNYIEAIVLEAPDITEAQFINYRQFDQKQAGQSRFLCSRLDNALSGASVKTNPVVGTNYGVLDANSKMHSRHGSGKIEISNRSEPVSFGLALAEFIDGIADATTSVYVGIRLDSEIEDRHAAVVQSASYDRGDRGDSFQNSRRFCLSRNEMVFDPSKENIEIIEYANFFEATKCAFRGKEDCDIKANNSLGNIGYGEIADFNPTNNDKCTGFYREMIPDNDERNFLRQHVFFLPITAPRELTRLASVAPLRSSEEGDFLYHCEKVVQGECVSPNSIYYDRPKIDEIMTMCRIGNKR